MISSGYLHQFNGASTASRNQQLHLNMIASATEEEEEEEEAFDVYWQSRTSGKYCDNRHRGLYIGSYVFSLMIFLLPTLGSEFNITVLQSIIL